MQVTDAMIKAGIGELIDYNFSGMHASEAVKRIFMAMMAAAEIEERARGGKPRPNFDSVKAPPGQRR